MVDSSHVWEAKVAGLGDGRPTVVRGRDMPGTTLGRQDGGWSSGHAMGQDEPRLWP